MLPIEKDPAWFGSSYQNLSPNLILLNWSPTRHLKVGPKIASPSFLSNSPPMYKSRFSIAPYNCCSLGTNCEQKIVYCWISKYSKQVDINWRFKRSQSILLSIKYKKSYLPQEKTQQKQTFSMILCCEAHKAVSILRKVPIHDPGLAVHSTQPSPYHYLMCCLETGAV